MDPRIFQLQGQVEDRHWWFTGRRHVLLELASPLLPDSGGVLDVGCGTGGNISAFPESYRRVGIDPTPEAIEIARAKEPGVTFICGFAPDDVSSELAETDLVLITDVLEHVEKDRELLAGLVAGMKQGSHIIITVPADPRLWSPHDTAHGHFRRYLPETLMALWADLPVHPLLVAPLNRRLRPVVRTVRFLTKILGRGGGEAGSDLKLPSKPVNAILHRVFAGEAGVLVRALSEGARPPAGLGVSLVAVLRKE